MLDRVIGGNRCSRLLRRALSLSVLSLTAWLWPAAWRFVLPALSPHVASCSAVALRAVSVSFLLSLPMLAAMALSRRFFCRHLCPVGLIVEICGKLSLRRKVHSGEANDEKTPPVGRYLYNGRQENTRRAMSDYFPVPAFTGRFLALASFGGALAGYPLFLWMDPLALFSGFFNVFGAPGGERHLVSVAGLVIVMLISVAFVGLWCSAICPLGGTQDLLAQGRRMFFRGKTKGPKSCRNEEFSQRRFFLAAGLTAVFSAVIPRTWPAKRRWLRPPGSVDETNFRGVCIRCGNCIRSCPTGIIEPSLDSRDLAGLLGPRLRFSGPNYCREDCNQCGCLCPTGAIRPLALQEKNRHIIGLARIDLSECLLTMDEECGVCIPRCPRAAIVEDFSRKTYTTAVRVVSGKCNGCGACVGICPAKVVRVETVGAGDQVNQDLFAGQQQQCNRFDQSS